MTSPEGCQSFDIKPQGKGVYGIAIVWYPDAPLIV
jgi:hypothetical protein